MGYTNALMESMLRSLGGFLERRDVIGYAAARNTRILRDELTEYAEVRDRLVAEFGEPEFDEDGNPTGSVSLPIASPKFPEFMEAIAPYAAIEHEPHLFKLKFEQAIGELSGSELLAIDWMFEE